VVDAARDDTPKAASAASGALAAMIGPLLRIATSTIAARGIREAAAEATNRAMLTLAAGIGGGVAVFCFTRAGFTLLERQVDPAEAWAIIGGFYAVLGGALYFAGSRRRRG
jgi:hypothetical protein